MTDDIEKYLEAHPDYDPKKDHMVNKFGDTTGDGYEFNYQRDVVSGSAAAYQSDATGLVLSTGGVFPVAGGFASAISLGRDLMQFEVFNYVPPIPR